MLNAVKEVYGKAYIITCKPFTDIVLIRTPIEIHFLKFSDDLREELLKYQHEFVSVSYVENNRTGIGAIIRINN